jgi:hypothetical protein
MTRRLLVLSFALLLVATACGGGDDAGEGVASLSGVSDDEVIAVPQPEAEIVEATQEDALLSFTACLRENGVEIEDPTVAADGSVEFRFRGAGPQDEDFDREAARSAREVCSDLLEGVTFAFADRDFTEVQDTLYEYAACMRDNDYEMDDLDFSTPGPGGGGDGQGEETGVPRRLGPIDPEDPAFVAANEVCGDILSGFVPGAGLGRGPGGGRPGGGDEG